MNIRNSLRSQNGMLHSDALLIRISATGISNFTIIKVTKTYNFLLAGQHFGHIAVLLTFLTPSGQHFKYIAVLLTFLAPSGQHFGHMAVLLTF